MSDITIASDETDEGPTLEEVMVAAANTPIELVEDLVEEAAGSVDEEGSDVEE